MTGETAQNKRETRKLQVELFVLSLLALFLELLVIRWLSTEVRIFAYFKNLPLMSAFLGLGLGFIWAGKKWDLYKWSAFALLWLCGLMICAFRLGITYLTFVDPGQFMLFGVIQDSSGLLATLRSLAVMVVIFVLSASLFCGLGQRMGRLFGKMEPLKAYSINVLGGLCGTILFSLLCFMGLSPAFWLLVAGMLFFYIDKRPVSVAVAGLGILYGVWAGPFITRATFGEDYVKTVWSPYYRIDVLKVKAPDGPFKGTLLGYDIYVNYDSFQSIVDCTDATVSKFPEPVRREMLSVHTEPFKLRDSQNKEVLILGSGSGSDVSAALRSGAAHVDAVEIDRSITELGKELHPEKPYDSDKVSLFITDARNYLKNCSKKYDVIVFAALDSHAAFSSLSSLRMDDYVFTVEAIKEAAGLLKPEGIISINFVIPQEFLWQRHIKAMSEALGSLPLAFREHQAGAARDGGLLIAGPGISNHEIPANLAGRVAAPIDINWPTPVATDDWPFLFLPKREIPTLYILPILAVLLVSCIPVSMEFISGAGKMLHWQMFFLGMAFMMLEVRAMADLSLLYGSTWIVNSVIISAVMLVILFANYLAVRLKTPLLSGVLLAVIFSLFLTSFMHASDFSSLGPLLGGILGTALFVFPLAFAALVFALLFKDAESPPVALAFNLLGGLLGICLEYLSMAIGIRALSWVAILIYGAVFALQIIKTKRAPGKVA